MANDEVNGGIAKQPGGEGALGWVGAERYSWPQCRNTTVNWEPARRAALASARTRSGLSRLTSQGRWLGSRNPFRP